MLRAFGPLDGGLSALAELNFEAKYGNYALKAK
jgi:hypothetical protein